MFETADWQQFLPPALFILVMLGMFWWIVIKPTQSRQKKHQQLIKDLVEGDGVVTVGGIHGTIRRVRDDTLEVEIADGTRVTLERRAVRRLKTQEDF